MSNDFVLERGLGSNLRDNISKAFPSLLAEIHNHTFADLFVVELFPQFIRSREAHINFTVRDVVVGLTRSDTYLLLLTALVV